MSKLVEEWRPVVGFEGLYEVSDWGRVRSVEKVVDCGKNTKRIFEEKIKAQQTHYKGYKLVGLCKDGKPKTVKVHRLVAEAFIPNPNNFPQVNHKDEDKTNNNVDNLEWCNNKYNCNYGTKPERFSQKMKGRVLPKESLKKMVETRKNNGKEWNTDETKKKISIALKGKMVGEKNPMYGKHHTDEVKKKISEINKGRKHTDEAKKKMSEARKGKKQSDEHKRKRAEASFKEVIQYSLDGELVKIWKSIKEAANELGISSANISTCCRGRLKSVGGYKWKYSST